MTSYNELLNTKDENDTPSYNELTKATETPLYRRLADVGVTGVKSAVGAVETGLGLADIPTGGSAGRAAQKVGFDPKLTKQYLDTLYSPAQQEANKKVAEAKGFIPTIKAYVENPSVALHQAGEQVLPIAVGGKIGGAVTNALKNYAPKAAGYIGAGAGEAAITAGQNVEQVRQEAPGGELTAGQIAPVVGSAAVTGLIGAGGAKVATKFGLSDPEALATGLVTEATSKPLTKAARIPLSVAAEGAEELLQSPQEQVSTNYALDRPLLEGVPEAAAQGLVLGSTMGAGSVAVDPATYRPDAQPQSAEPSLTQATTIDQQPPPPPSLTQAATVAVETGAVQSKVADINRNAINAELMKAFKSKIYDPDVLSRIRAGETFDTIMEAKSNENTKDIKPTDSNGIGNEIDAGATQLGQTDAGNEVAGVGAANTLQNTEVGNRNGVPDAASTQGRITFDRPDGYKSRVPKLQSRLQEVEARLATDPNDTGYVEAENTRISLANELFPEVVNAIPDGIDKGRLALEIGAKIEKTGDVVGSAKSVFTAAGWDEQFSDPIASNIAQALAPDPVVEQKPAEAPPVAEQKPAEAPPVAEQKPAEAPTPAPVAEQKPAETPTPAPVAEQKPAETPTPAPIVEQKQPEVVAASRLGAPPLTGWNALYTLANKAKEDGTDLSRLSRTQYLDYAEKHGVILDDDQLRTHSSVRTATTPSEVLAIAKQQTSKGTEEEKQAYDRQIYSLIESTKTNNGYVSEGVKVASSNDHGGSWLHFLVGDRGNKDKESATPKAYIGFDSVVTALSGDNLQNFLRDLHASGYNGQAKILQDAYHTGKSAINDQLVLHGNTEDDAALGLDVAKKFFGNQVVFEDVGYDKDGLSYSQWLAKEHADRVNKNNAAQSSVVPEKPFVEQKPVEAPPVAEQKQTEVVPEKPDITQEYSNASKKQVTAPPNASGSAQSQVLKESGNRPENSARLRVDRQKGIEETPDDEVTAKKQADGSFAMVDIKTGAPIVESTFKTAKQARDNFTSEKTRIQTERNLAPLPDDAPILRLSKDAYLEQATSTLKMEDAKKRVADRYEQDRLKAEVSVPFDKYKRVYDMSDVSDDIKLSAYNSAREEFGLEPYKPGAIYESNDVERTSSETESSASQRAILARNEGVLSGSALASTGSDIESFDTNQGSAASVSQESPDLAGDISELANTSTGAASETSADTVATEAATAAETDVAVPNTGGLSTSSPLDDSSTNQSDLAQTAENTSTPKIRRAFDTVMSGETVETQAGKKLDVKNIDFDAETVEYTDQDSGETVTTPMADFVRVTKTQPARSPIFTGESDVGITTVTPNRTKSQYTVVTRDQATGEQVPGGGRIFKSEAEALGYANAISKRDATDSYSKGLPTQEIPIKDVSLSNDVPQFKSDANANGVVEKLTGKYERTGTAPIQLWQRNNGQLEVISGRHRLDLARRTGEQTIPSQIHKESDGFTSQDASRLDAELNIRDGQGTVKDYVNYFKATGIDENEANKRGLVGRTLGRTAFGIATNGSEETISAHRNDAIKDQTAYTIATSAPNDSALQAVGLKSAQDGKSDAYIANQIKAVKLLRSDTPMQTTDLFGFDDSAMREAEALAKRATEKQNELVALRKAARIGVRADSLQGKTEGQVSVTIRNKEQLNKHISNLDAQIRAWDNWSTNPELISQLRENTVVGQPASSENLLTPVNAVGSNVKKESAPSYKQQDFVTDESELSSLEAKQKAFDIERAKDQKRNGNGTEPAPLFSDNAGVAGQQDLKFSKAESPQFYSQLRRSFESAPDKVFANSQQAKSWLKANAPKQGVKSDEIYWSGVEDYLDANPKAKKQDVLKYLDENGVKAEDVVLGKAGKGRSYDEIQTLLSDFDTYPAGSEERARLRAEQENATDYEHETKHNNENLTLPGGQNYQETIVTIPSVEKFNESDSTHFGDVGQGKQIAWMRHNDRADANGNKVLFLEEIQSQRGQEGRKYGFYGTKVSLPDNEQSRYEELKSILQLRKDKGEQVTQAPEFSEYKKLKEKLQSLKQNQVPPAPFVTDSNNKATNAYISLLMKKAVMKAVENGQDHVAWTTGTQQQDRYDISKQVNTIDYIKSSNGNFSLGITDKDGQGVDLPKEEFTPEELPDVVGKDIAEKIISGQGQPGGGRMTLRGVDLRLGGEWAQSMYGNEQGLDAKGAPSLITKAAKDIAKRFGGQIGTIKLDTGNQPALIITPEMKAKILGEGVPLFSQAKKATGSTKAQVESWLDSKDKELLKSGRLNIAETKSEIPKGLVSIDADGVEGFYDPKSKQVWVVAENVSQDTIRSVLNHEYLHAGLVENPALKDRLLKANSDLRAVFDAVEKGTYGGKYKDIYNAAMRRVDMANTSQDDRFEEFLAYSISEYSKSTSTLTEKLRKIIQNILATIRAAMFKYSGHIGKITPADLTALARSTVTSQVPRSDSKNANDIRYSVKDFFTGNPREVDSLADVDTIIRTGKMPTRAVDKQAILDKAATLFVDSTRPFDVLMRKFPDSWRVVRDKDVARRKVSAKEREAVNQFMRPLSKTIAKIAKDSKMDYRAAKELVGQWMTARYAIEKNGDYIRQDAAKVSEAEKALVDNTAQDKIAQLKAAVTRAKTAQRERYEAIHEQRFIDARLEGLSARLAGGYNNFTAEEMMRRYEGVIPRAQLETAAKQVYDMLKWKVDLDLETGKVTQEQVDAWFNSPYYVPLTGDPSVDTSEDELFAHGGVNQTADKRAVGRAESIAKNGIDAAVEQVQKSARYYGWGDFKDSLSNLYDKLIQDELDNGASMVEAKNAVSKYYQFTKTRLTDGFVSDTAITYRKNGEQWAFDLHNAEAIDALKSINKEQIPSLLQPVAFFTRSYARFVTQLLPGFGAVNAIRDVWERSENIRARVIPGYESLDMNTVANTALKNAAHVGIIKKLMAVLLESTLSAGKIAFDPADPEIQSIRLMIESGATSTVGDYLSSNSADLSKQLKSLSGWGDAAMEYVNAWNTAFELVATHSIFSSLVEHGVDPKTASAATLNLMNFGKSGTITGPLRALYVFVNPVFQGGHQLVQTLSSRRGQARAAAYFLAGTALYAMLRAIDGDDDDTGENKMDNISSFMLERNIHIPFGDNNYLKMPIGFGLPQAMWGAATNIGKFMFGNQSAGDTFVETFKSFSRTMAPVAPSEASISEHPIIWMAQTFSPQIAKPFVNVGLDTNMFGQALTNSRFARDDRALALQGRKTTPEWYKSIAKELGVLGINVYPETVREIIRGYAVGPLNEVIKAAVENPAKEKLGRETVSIVIDRFVSAHDSGYLKDRLYYRYRDEMNEAAVKKSLDRELTPRETELAKLQEIVKKLENKANGKLASATKAGNSVKATGFRTEGERIRESAKTLTIKTMRRLDD